MKRSIVVVDKTTHRTAKVADTSVITLTSHSVVEIPLKRSQVKSFTRHGDVLVITLADNEATVVHGFFSDQQHAGQNNIVLQNDEGLWQADLSRLENSPMSAVLSQAPSAYQPLDNVDTLLNHQSSSSSSPSAAWAALPVLLVAAAGCAAGGGGGSSDTYNAPQPRLPSATPTDTLTAMDNKELVVGLIHSGDKTNDPTPTLSGSGTPGDLVVVYDGNTPLGSVTVQGDSTWRFIPTSHLSDGSHSLSYTYTNDTGIKSGRSPSLDFSVDTVPPATPANAPGATDHGSPIHPGDTTSDNTPTLAGSGVTPGDTITIYDGTTAIGTVTVNTGGNWSYTLGKPLADGQHELSYTDADPAGNESGKSPGLDINIHTTSPAMTEGTDTTAPGAAALTATGNGGGSTNSATASIYHIESLTGAAQPDGQATPTADRIDVSELLIGYTPAQSSGPAHYINGVATIDAGDTIAQFLSAQVVGNDTVISVDRDGAGDAYQMTPFLTLDNVQVDLATLLANHQFVLG